MRVLSDMRMSCWQPVLALSTQKTLPVPSRPSPSLLHGLVVVGTGTQCRPAGRYVPLRSALPFLPAHPAWNLMATDPALRTSCGLAPTRSRGVANVAGCGLRGLQEGLARWRNCGPCAAPCWRGRPRRRRVGGIAAGIWRGSRSHRKCRLNGGGAGTGTPGCVSARRVAPEERRRCHGPGTWGCMCRGGVRARTPSAWVWAVRADRSGLVSREDGGRPELLFAHVRAAAGHPPPTEVPRMRRAVSGGPQSPCPFCMWGISRWRGGCAASKLSFHESEGAA